MKAPKEITVTVKLDTRKARKEIRLLRKEVNELARMFTKRAKRLPR